MSLSSSAGGDNQADRLPGLAADLVRLKAAVIVGNTPAVMAAVRVASPTVPLVFVVGHDPVKSGLVASLNRPEGNLTGVTFFGGSLLGAKRLALLQELVPKISLVAVLLDPDTGSARPWPANRPGEACKRARYRRGL